MDHKPSSPRAHPSITDYSDLESRPPGKKVEIQDIGAPSWIEEQRAARAFWRLQLVYDLKKAAARDILRWSEPDLATLKKTAALNRQPVWTGRQDFYHSEAHSHQGAALRCAPEYAELISILNYIEEIYGREAAAGLTDGQICLKEIQGFREVKRTWPIHRLPGYSRDIVQPSTGVQIYWDMGGYQLYRVKFDVFGRYGFAFWSQKRLRGYGLISYLKSDSYPIDAQYAWQSILTLEDIDRA